MKIRVFAWLLAVCLSAAVAAPQPARAAKDELVIGMTQFPSTFHPSIDSMLAKTYVLAMTRRPFTQHDANWNLVCMLCTELPTIENGGAKPEKTPDGKDGIAVTYTIAPGARWGDGVPVTTKDVIFAWKVGRHPLTGVSNMELYRSLYKVEAKDDRTFTLHFDKLTYEYNAINDLNILPAHLETKPFEADPAAYKNKTLYDTDTTNKGLYYGPYRVSQVVANAHVVLVPNETWFGKKPHFKRIVVKVIDNTAALEANLLSGNIDMIAGELGLTIDQAILFAKRHGSRFDVVFKPGLIYEHIDLNLDNPILKDARVRRALLLAIDRAGLSKELFDGRQPIAHTNVNPLDWVHDKDVPKHAFDPKAAAKLLDDAGWNVMKGGIRHNAKGERLTLEFGTTAANRSRELVQQVLQSQWKKIGVDIRIKNQPARVFFGETVTKRRFPAMAMFAWYSAPEGVPRTTLHSKHIPTEANNWAGQNYTGFANKEVDDLIEKIEVELDREKRRALWKRLQEIYATELPVLPLYFRADSFIMPKWLKGLVPTGHQGISTFWVEHWTAAP